MKTVTRPITWWSLFAVDAIAWIILFGLAVSKYSEGANRPGYLDPTIYILSGLGIALFAIAIVVTLVNIRKPHVDKTPRIEVSPS